MNTQAWTRSGELVVDTTIFVEGNLTLFRDNLTGITRPATDEEIAMLPNPDEARAKELLSMSPAVITQPEIWELLRIFGRHLGLSD